MKPKQVFFCIVLILAIYLPSCVNNNHEKNDRIVVAIPADAESLNPLFAFSFQEVNITELLYLSLVQHEWNDSDGDVKTSPMAAKNWVWNDDSTTITLNLRDDINWRDGHKLTAEDVIFSFDVYSDPDVQSRFFGTFNKFYLEKDQHIDLQKSFDSDNPYTIKIHFKPHSNPGLVDIDPPILPKHVFSNFDRKKFVQLEKGNDSVTCGPFYLSKWNPTQSIILKADENSFLYKPGTVKELIFKVIPDYNSRVTQLKNGEIDLMENVKPDQLSDLKALNRIKISAVKGREYDYAGWNNKIDLFSNPKVRNALTYAINREEILTEYLGNNGDLAVGPVAPIFKDSYNHNLKPFDYDPQKAKELLASDGWEDINKDGILEKNGVQFSFILNYAGGNPRREFAATVIKNNLKAIGVDVKAEPLEQGVFMEKMFTHKLNAWLAGWSVPIPIDLKPYWYSDLKQGSFNLTSYKNSTVDELLDKIEKSKPGSLKNELYKQLQEILYQDEPVSFLYWIDNNVAYNDRLENIKITPLGSVHHCWNWSVKN
ncbi:MAG: ABC transporter substrate-binding protein [Ignavibacteriaceae bacterium]|nr:ABC transporter substrate-binding protein [Ignavibacteriaceae bacterium]